MYEDTICTSQGAALLDLVYRTKSSDSRAKA